MKTKTKEKARDFHAEILALGWDTESTTAGRMMASRGILSTEWLESWEAVYKAICLGVCAARRVEEEQVALDFDGDEVQALEDIVKKTSGDRIDQMELYAVHHLARVALELVKKAKARAV